MIYSSNAFQLVMAKTTVLTSLLFDGTGPGNGGIFAPIMAQITTLAKDLWGVIIGLIVIGAALAMILSVLRGTGGMLIGGSKETTVASCRSVRSDSTTGKFDEKPHTGTAVLGIQEAHGHT
jgi:hypothetical protein